MADDDDTPKRPKFISRIEASDRGLKRFFTGVPCVNGHVAERMVNGRACVVCLRDVKPTPKEKQAAYRAAWRRRNIDRIREAKAAPEKREAARAKNRAYRQANPDKIKAKRSNAEAKRRASEGNYTLADVRRILKAQKGKCAYCRTSVGDDYHVDHIVPLANGGTNWPRNLQVTCGPCNLTKGARDPIMHAQTLGLLL